MPRSGTVTKRGEFLRRTAGWIAGLRDLQLWRRTPRTCSTHQEISRIDECDAAGAVGDNSGFLAGSLRNAGGRGICRAAVPGAAGAAHTATANGFGSARGVSRRAGLPERLGYIRGSGGAARG